MNIRYCTWINSVNMFSCVESVDQLPQLCILICLSTTWVETQLIHQLQNDKRFDSITEGLGWLFGDDYNKIDQWLTSPCNLLEEEIPIEILDFGDIKTVENAVARMIELDYFANIR